MSKCKVSKQEQVQQADQIRHMKPLYFSLLPIPVSVSMPMMMPILPDENDSLHQANKFAERFFFTYFKLLPSSQLFVQSKQ